MSPRSVLKRLIREGRIVVKIGSGVLTDDHGRIEPKTVRRLAREVAPLIGLRRWPFIVSSGAIAVGMGVLGLKSRPRTMAGLQAAAAVGQGKLMEAWSQAFRKHDVHVAQILLTHSDLANRKRFLNARRALGELERRRAMAIINENDTVSFEEIAFGDNDQLAALVSNLVDAQLLIMLSTASGITNDDGERVPHALCNDGVLDTLVRPVTSRFGAGGMLSKLRAARVATSRGAYVAIVDGKRPGAIEALLDGEDIGTLLLPGDGSEHLSSRAHWIVHALRPSGTLVVDEGAQRALRDRSKSLLARGVTSVRGNFAEGDAVEIAVVGGQAFARGLTRYSSEQMNRIAGLPSTQIRRVLGFTSGDAVVHRDDLVLLS